MRLNSKLKLRERKAASFFGEVTPRVAFQRHYRNGRTAGWELITDQWERVWSDDDWRFKRRDQALTDALVEAEAHYRRALRVRAMLSDSYLTVNTRAYHPVEGARDFSGIAVSELPDGWVLDLRSPSVAALLADALLSLRAPEVAMAA